MTRAPRKIHHPGLGLGLAGAVLVTAGARLPPPVQLMDRAQSEIRAARTAGAATTAPEALAEAERRLASAQQFSANGDNGKATDKAQEAEAAAATARARAEVARLDKQIDQQSSVNASLQADLERREAAAAAAQQAVGAPPASGSSGGSGAVNLPPIQLGQPAAPASGASAATPASGTTAASPASAASSGIHDSGDHP
jgi:hypothetical protein